MRITTKGRYALRAVYTLALKSNNKPVSVRELAEKEEISPEFLEQIFFRLKKTEMITSTRGPGGGFQLNRKPKEISLYDILDAAGEGIDFSPCLSEEPERNSCTRIDECIARDVWQEASSVIRKYFENITLQNIIDKNKVA